MFEGLIGVILIVGIYGLIVIMLAMLADAFSSNSAEPTMKSSPETLYRMRKKKYHWLNG